MMDDIEAKVTLEMAEKVLELKTNPKNDTEHAGHCAAILYKLVKLRCQREREWYEAKEKVLLPRDKEYTELDRTVKLEAGVAEVYEAFQYVKGLEELVQQRIELYKLMMQIKE